MQPWHRTHQQVISHQFSTGTLPHAILICGAHGAGKYALATWLINAFNCQHPTRNNDSILSACKTCKTCLLSKSKTNPDAMSIEGVERNISVEDVRRVTHFLETKSQIAAGKSVFIASAEKLTDSAANALLKTLEEPSQSSLIVLTCSDQESVLATILSRCQVLMIRPFVGKALGEVVHASETDPYTNINAVAEHTNPELNEQYRTFNQEMVSFVQSGLISSALNVAILNHEYGVIWFERFIINLLRKKNNWQVSKEVAETRGELPLNTHWQVYQLVIEAKKKLKSLVQANPLFVKEQLIADIQMCITKSGAIN